jgi:hypothetical protein
MVEAAQREEDWAAAKEVIEIVKKFESSFDKYKSLGYQEEAKQEFKETMFSTLIAAMLDSTEVSARWS